MPIGDLVDEHRVAEPVGAEQRVVRARRLGRLAEVALPAPGHSTSCISVLLPEPETPVTQTRRCSGNSTVTFLQVVLARAFEDRGAASTRSTSALEAHADVLARAEVGAGQRVGAA